MRLYIKRSYLLLLFFTVALSYNASSQNIRDSFDLLIKTETDDSTRVRLMIRCLNYCEIKLDSEILSYLNEIVVQAKKLNSDDLLFLAYYIGATQLSNRKNGIDASKKLFKELLKLAQAKNNKEYIVKSQIGLGAFLSQEGKISEAKKLYHSLISILQDSDLNETKATVYNMLSFIYRNESQFEKANLALDTVINLLKEDTISDQLFSAYSSKGRIFRFLGENDSAKFHYKFAEKIAISSGKKLNLAIIYNNLGNIEHVQGNYEQALQYYFNSIQIKNQTKDHRGLTIGHHNIGAIYLDMKDWNKALDNFTRSNEMAQDIDFKVLMVHNENKIGDVLSELKQYDKALNKYKLALEIAEKINFQNGICTSLYKIGNNFLHKNEFQKSSSFLIRALNKVRETKNKPTESAILIAIAENYIKSAKKFKTSNLESESFNAREILNYLISAKEMAAEMNNVENKLKALEGLSLFYSSNNNYKQNVNVLMEYNSLKDTLFEKNRVESIADWETKYETAEKEKEIVALEAQNEISNLKSLQLRNLLIFLTLLFAVISFFGYYYLRQKNKRTEALKRESFRAKLSSDLHDDVGSTLTGLAMQSELLSNFIDGNLKKSAENIALLSRDAMTRMRDTVWAIDSRKDKLDDLIGRIQDFAQTNLLAKDISFTFDVRNLDKSLKIEPELRQNIYLIFKECIANVLKHSNATIVQCQLKIEDKNLSLLVSDNGIFDEALITTSGIGMTSINERARTLNGKITKSTTDGFSVLLTVPI